MSPGKQFRAALAGPDMAVFPASYNTMTALLAARAGFSATYFGGSAVTNTLLGMPDAGFLTLSEMEFLIARASAVCPIPIMVDADTGYGNAVGVVHTVRTLERAGAAAILIEDQVTPPRCGHVAGGDVVPIEEMIDKIKAAVDARRDPDFFILSRTDSRRVMGLEEAVERGNRFAEAGADGFMADGLLSAEELSRVGGGVSGTLRFTTIAGSSKRRTTPKLPLPQLQAMGFACALLGLQTVRAGGQGALRALLDRNSQPRGSAGATAPETPSHLKRDEAAEWRRLTGADATRDLEHRFLHR